MEQCENSQILITLFIFGQNDFFIFIFGLTEDDRRQKEVRY